MPFTDNPKIIEVRPQWLVVLGQVNSGDSKIGSTITFPVPPSTGVIRSVLELYRNSTGAHIGTLTPGTGVNEVSYVRTEADLGSGIRGEWVATTASGRPLANLPTGVSSVTTVATGSAWDWFVAMGEEIPDGRITWEPITGPSGWVATGRRGKGTVKTTLAAPPAGFTYKSARGTTAPNGTPTFPGVQFLEELTARYTGLVYGTTEGVWNTTNGALAGYTNDLWVYAEETATGQRRLAKLLQFTAEPEVIIVGDDVINVNAVGGTAALALADAKAKHAARKASGNAGKFVIGLPTYNYGDVIFDQKANPDQEIVFRSIEVDVGGGRPGARFTKLVLDDTQYTSYSYLNIDRDGLALGGIGTAAYSFQDNANVFVYGGHHIGFRNCNVELRHKPAGGWSTLYTAEPASGVIHFATGVDYGVRFVGKSGAVVTYLEFASNRIEGPFQFGIGGATGTTAVAFRRNVSNNVNCDDYQFVQGTWLEEENWYSRDIHPSYNAVKKDWSHSDCRQTFATWAGEAYVFDGLISRRNVGATRSILSGTLQSARQGCFSSNCYNANNLVEGNIFVLQHVTGIGFSNGKNIAGGSNNNIARYNTMLAVIDYPRVDNMAIGTCLYSPTGINGPACVRNVFAWVGTGQDYLPQSLRIPITRGNYTAQDNYYNSSRRADSLYRMRPKLGSGCHYLDADKYGAYETYERIIEGKIGMPQSGPARASWEENWNQYGEISIG